MYYAFLLIYQGGHLKILNYFLEDAPLVVLAFPARLVFQGPICISVLAGVVVSGCIGLQEILFEDSSMHLPTSRWVIYERTCPHGAECSAVFDHKRHDLKSHPPHSPNLPLSDFFLFVFPDEKVLKGKCLADVEEVKQQQKH